MSRKSVIHAIRHVDVPRSIGKREIPEPQSTNAFNYVVYLCDCWLPALEITRCTLRTHDAYIAPLPWQANWHSARIARPPSSVIQRGNILAAKTRYVTIFGIFCPCCMRFIHSACYGATSFSCHHTQFVVITIETKWREFKTRMWRTHLVAERI